MQGLDPQQPNDAPSQALAAPFMQCGLADAKLEQREDKQGVPLCTLHRCNGVMKFGLRREQQSKGAKIMMQPISPAATTSFHLLTDAHFVAVGCRMYSRWPGSGR